MTSMSPSYDENLVTVRAIVFEKNAKIYAIRMQVIRGEQILENGVRSILLHTLRVRNRGGAPNWGAGRNFGGPLYKMR